MGDDYKDFKRGKPQQKLYKPGSGPLRRSGYGLDAKMDSFELSRSRDRIHYGSRNSLNGEEGNTATREQSNTRHKKPEQQLYVARNADSNTDVDRHSKRCDNSSQYNNRRNSSRPEKHGFSAGTFPKGSSKRDRYAEYQSREGLNTDINYNRNYRQQSETRSTSPTHCNKEQNMSDRNRDSRSMETSTGRHMSGAGGKPPSGRRNSAGYPGDSSRPPKHMINLDNLPPRFRKKYLEQQSVLHSFDSVDHINRDRQVTNNAFHSSSFNHNQPLLHNSHAGWSQTLPSRGRGRLKDNEGFDREKFISTYLRNNDINNSRRSTPSSSYMNLYEPNAIENRRMNDDDSMTSSYTSQKDIYDDGTMINKNGIGMTNNDDHNHKLDMSEDQNISHNISETISHISSTLMDMTNLDWTEEVEKNINLEDACDSSSTSFSQNINPTVTQDIKPVESKESKRSGKSRRDRRSSSRGHRNSDKRSERYRKDSNVSVQHEPERNRKDSSVSLQHETVGGSMKQKERDKTRKDSNVNLQHEASRQRERCRKDSNASLQHEAIVSSVKHAGRERRDSHKSNRSSTLGNSRDDLDRWRSLRSYSREHSTERRIVSQCNSRDPSANRALSPRDHDGFRMPTAVPKQSNTGNGNHKKNNGARTASTERGRQSPAPEPGSRARKAKRSSRRRHRHAEPPGAAPAPNSNWREEILESKKHDKPSENTHQRNRLNSAMSEKSESSTSHPGIIILPQSTISHMQKDQVRCGSVENQKHLFDYHNPSKPIIVQTSPTKVDMRMERGVKEASARGATSYESGDAARAARHRALLQEVDRADAILQTHMLRSPVSLADHWTDVGETRKLLQNALQKLLMSDLKYCQADNVEHNFWKILYYNFIEILRKSFSQVSPEDKKKIVTILNVIIDEGNSYFENLIQMLEKTYKFNTDDYINDNHLLPPKGMGYVGLALISVQKLYVFLGDLARYKEQVNETNNYAKSKYWYTKAQQINPKNGRPYNQLAILAIYARRKLDAVYYYMRSLMSSNPFHSARESLISLFDENRKKYEIAERKRRAALETCKSEGSDTSISGSGSGVKREVWVRPSGHRTTVQPDNSSPKENLAAMSNVELNKNFITSYLHVHGKLITKIGMETFYESAGVMLRQFRALLQRQPLPTPAARLLQLTALNMFAVETNSHQKGENSTGERSASLECALGVSLLMFGALVERCCALLPEPVDTQQHTDARTLLPAVKVWSDWMLCHSSVWNPPPSFEHFEIQTDNDPWDWLANLMNILERLDDKSIEFENESKEGYVAVRLCEDASLAGFTPLMYMEPAAAWTRDTSAPHDAEHALRARKLLFFGTEYLVGVEPPVLSLEYPVGGAAGGAPRYVRALRPAHAPRPPLQNLCEDSEEDSTSGPGDGVTSASETGAVTDADDATRRLLRRKEQLETRRAHLERRKQRMQEILGGGGASVDVEVRPRWLVPDTNCFIDHLRLLQALVAPPTMPYQLAVPLVVVSELKGLGKCSRLGENARAALEWIQGGGSGVRLATTKGSLLASRAFTDESDLPRGSNDDRVLTTALSLQDVLSLTAVEPQDTDSKCRVREVVLLTDDRNLRVKALAAEVPARELRAFVQWAGVSDDATDKSTEKPATGLK